MDLGISENFHSFTWGSMLIFTNQETFEIGENIYGTLYIKLDDEFPFKCSLRMTYKVTEKLSYTVEVTKKVGNIVKKK
jgi:galactose mutarotase-like enzyme